MIEFDSAKSISDILTHINDLIMSGRYAFRGYSHENELLPGVVRNGESYKLAESLWLEEFEKYGSHYFQANSSIDFLSYAQHFGLPTRLLDFTTNPYIALYFAFHAKKEREEDEFYYLCYADLDSNIVLNTIPFRERLFYSTLRTGLLAKEAKAAIRDIESVMSGKDKDVEGWIMHVVNQGLSQLKKEYLKELIDKRKILFIDPKQANSRIIMQQGIFMLPYTLSKEDHLSIVKNNCEFIKIHRSHRKGILAFLSEIGFNAYRLMPDIASVCAAIRNESQL